MVRSYSDRDRTPQTVGDPGLDVHWPTVYSTEVTSAHSAAQAVRIAVLGAGAQYDPLLDLSCVADLAGADVVERDLAAGSDGCQALLIPLVNDRFRVVVDPTPRDGWTSCPGALRTEVAAFRTRFRIGH